MKTIKGIKAPLPPTMLPISTPLGVADCVAAKPEYKYSTYYEPMGNLLTSALNRVGLSILYLYKNFELKRGWAYNTSWAYNTYYTVAAKIWE